MLDPMTPTATEHDAPPAGLCWECGYPLQGLPTPRCPECGRSFDPVDPTTMNTGQVVGPVTRWLMSPPGWAMYLLLAGAVVVSVWACVVPTRVGAFSDILSAMLLSPRSWRWRLNGIWGNLDYPAGRFLVGVVLWSMLALVWIVRRVARGVTVRRVSRQRAATFAYWRRWLVVPVIFGVTTLVCMTRLPTYAGFWLSKPWLERAVREPPPAPGGIGLFGRCEVLPGGGGAIVNLWSDAYLMRRDDGQVRPVHPGYRVTRLSANWILFEPDRISN
jgi:hypothetical protein